MADLLQVAVNIPVVENELGQLVPEDDPDGGIHFDHEKKCLSAQNESVPESAGVQSQSSIDIEFKEISLAVKERNNKGWKGLFDCKSASKVILNSVSGRFQSGQLTAVMGPSGAGKSSLMNVLAGFRRTGVTGDILDNGELRNHREFQMHSCYIMQDDHLLSNLSVWESMMYAAELLLSTTSKTAKQKRVMKILRSLGLFDLCASWVCDLSGGQRKRLSIALELVNNPPVMFFDEPTSGLDSSSCYSCINLLKSLAESGRTIICTIHQPSATIFNRFDHLYMLAEGKCIYQGKIPALVPYLASQNLLCPSYHNPADFVTEVACGYYGDVNDKLSRLVRRGMCLRYQKYPSLEHSYSEVMKLDGGIIDDMELQKDIDSISNSSYHSPDIAPIVPCNKFNEFSNVVTTLDLQSNSDGISNFSPCKENLEKQTKLAMTSFHQAYVLFRRTVKTQFRDSMLFQLRLAAHVIIGLLIGALYFDVGNQSSKAYDNTGQIFFSSLFLVFTGLMPTIMTFPLEMTVFLREHLNCWYHIKSYFLAKMLADIPFQIALPLIYCSIVYWMTGQPSETWRFITYIMISISITLVAQSMGLLIGASVSAPVAIFLGPVVSIPILLFCGFFVSFETIPDYLEWLCDVSYMRYGFEGYILALYSFDRPELTCSEKSPEKCIFRNGSQIIEHFNMTGRYLSADLAVLLGNFLLFRLVCYLVLRYRAKVR